MTHHIGILAYGSLIGEPGAEIGPVIARCIHNVETPLRVEFGRTSSTRDGAPTLVPVQKGGSQVVAKILVLQDDVSVQQAEDMLWRRETGNVGTGEPYPAPSEPGPNSVIVKELHSFQSIKTVLYTSIGANISNLSARALANLAIESAKATAGKCRRDGISYLAEMHRLGIRTPLSPEYEQEVLRQLEVDDLEAAWRAARTMS